MDALYIFIFDIKSASGGDLRRFISSHIAVFVFGRSKLEGEGEKGFLDVERKQVYFYGPTSKKLKKPGTAADGWVDFYVPVFLTFLPAPKKLPPIAAAHRELVRAGA